MTSIEIINILKELGSEKNRIGMARFGINTEKAFGVSMAEIRPIAKDIKKDHALAIELWGTGWHEARILAALIASPKEISSETMDEWANDFNSWDLCDQATMKLFCYSTLAWQKVDEWYIREEEFVKRASFALMASLALHEKSKDNAPFLQLLKMIEDKPDDERNFVKKAVNWALRQIGKRNQFLLGEARDTCNNILERYPESKAARWVAKDALREFEQEKIIERAGKSRHN